MAFAQEGYPFGMGGDSEVGEGLPALGQGGEWMNPRLDFRVADSYRFNQWAVDTNIRWQLFQGEHQTKANILNVLSKLEDKYQVRG